MELNEVASISRTLTIDNNGKRGNLRTPNIVLSDFDLKRLKAWTSVDRPDFWQFHAANGNRRYGLGTQNKYDVTTGKEKVEWDSFFERLQMLGFIEIERYDKKGYPVYSLKKAAYDFMENQE